MKGGIPIGQEGQVLVITLVQFRLHGLHSPFYLSVGLCIEWERSDMLKSPLVGKLFEVVRTKLVSIAWMQSIADAVPTEHFTGPYILRLSVGQPSCTYCITTFSVSSFFNSRLISSRRLSDAGNVTITAATNASDSASKLPVLSDYGWGFRERASAVCRNFAGVCSTVMLNCITRMRNLWILIGSSSSSFVVNSGTSGLWSVSTLILGMPIR